MTRGARTARLAVLLLAFWPAAARGAQQITDLYVCPEAERAWLVAVRTPPPRGRADDPPWITRVVLFSPDGKHPKADSSTDRPLLAGAFRERAHDAWGLCLVTDERTEWIEDGPGRTAPAPPLAAIRAFSAGGRRLYVLGDAVRQDTADDRAGEPVLLIFNGHLWQQWPYRLPGPVGRTDSAAKSYRDPQLVAFADGFCLLYVEGGRWVRYDCRDAAVGPRQELPTENAPPPTARMLAVGDELAAVELSVRAPTQWREIVLRRLAGDRWLEPQTIDVQLGAAPPGPSATAAFAARDGKLWVLLHDPDRQDNAFFAGRFEAGQKAVTLEPVAELGRFDPLPSQAGTGVLLALGIVGLLMLLIWRRGARDASWLVRDAALPVAPWSRRIAAAMIDLIPPAALSMVVFGEGWAELQRQIGAEAPNLSQAGWLAVGTLMGAYVLHTTISEMIARATLGKWLMHLTVVDERGRPARRGPLLIRNLLRVLDVAMPILALVMLLTRYRQRIGDLAARTVVALRTTPAESPAEPPPRDPPPPH
jgi:uncharacterized RDD family membrane protein YckC